MCAEARPNVPAPTMEEVLAPTLAGATSALRPRVGKAEKA